MKILISYQKSAPVYKYRPQKLSAIRFTATAWDRKTKRLCEVVTDFELHYIAFAHSIEIHSHFPCKVIMEDFFTWRLIRLKLLSTTFAEVIVLVSRLRIPTFTSWSRCTPLTLYKVNASDQELIQQLVSNEAAVSESGWQYVYKTYHPMVWDMVRQYGGSEDDAVDIFQMD